MLDERPTVTWMTDGDGLHMLTAACVLLLAALCIACVLVALAFFVSGKLTAAVLWALLANVVRPWR